MDEYEAALKEEDINIEFLDIKEAAIEKWSHSETLALLYSYNLHKDILHETKGRQLILQSIHEDLANQGIDKTHSQILNKWKNLLRTYRKIERYAWSSKKIRFRYMDAIRDILVGNANTITLPENDAAVLQDDTCSKTDPDQNIAIELSGEDNLDEIKDYIEYSLEDSTVSPVNKIVSDNISVPKSTLLNLKTKYLKNKIAEIIDRRNEREKYLNVVREAKRLKRKREERKLELKEKELEIEERKVSALEQYLELKRQKLLD